ncbi:MAG TPA: ABC transporter substrate-binding protein [Myxococcales bacterium]|nr:ABC transporter substrate-binding protein [Myxococcales bacterium]
MRIASLLPSATEMVCALGARAQLVGRSHECDFPEGIEEVPVLTSARIGALPSSEAIDRAVREVLADALSIYRIDLERLRAARPDVIVTQDLCDVCAVSLDDVRAALARLARQDIAIVNLRPMRLADIWDDVLRVADAIGRGDAGREIVASLRARVRAIARRAEAIARRPRVITIEWIAPVMIGGMWMPELVSLAGGTPLVTEPGQHAPTLDAARLAALDPEVVVVKPCGFSLSRTIEELDVLRGTLPRSWSARIYLADGNAYFNRPGPRIVESLEILAACLHPETFLDFAVKHASSFTPLP